MNGLLKIKLVALFIVVCGAFAVHAVPDYTSPQYWAVRETFSNETLRIEQTYRSELANLLKKQAHDLKARATRAKISKNKVHQADAAEFQKILTANLAALSKGGEVKLPEKVRPGNKRFLAVLKSSITSAARAKNDSTVMLRMNSRDKLRKLLEADGVNTTDIGVMDWAWSDLMAATKEPEKPEKNAEAAKNVSDKAAENVSEKDFADGGEEVVYAKSSEAKGWRILARLDATAGSMEILSLPLYPIKAGKKTITGTAVSGTTWTLDVSAPKAVQDPPEGQVAFRVKSIGNSPRIGILAWPSARNGWKLEVRVRPRGNMTRNSCLLEIGD